MANRILLLGSTGGTGQQVLSQGLQKGHEITALVRDPARLPENASGRVKVLKGSVPDDDGNLTTAVRGQDVVISTLGMGNSMKSSGLMARSTPAILRAMRSEGVRRLILMSSYGVGETRRDAPFLFRVLMRLFLQDLYADKEAGEILLRRSELDWTIVYPVTLTNGPRTGRYQVGERLSLHGLPRISRADVADFILAQVEDRTYLRKGVLISS